jgi:hypothetical protein
MNESTILELFKILINKTVIPKYPFLELDFIKKPSESINPVATVFYVEFTTSEPLDYTMVKQIKHDVNHLFKTAGFSFYKFRDWYYGVIVGIKDKKNNENY